MFPETLSNGAEYLSTLGKQSRAITGDDVIQYLMGKKGGAYQKLLGKDAAAIIKLLPGVNARNAIKIGRFAGRLAPAVSALSNVADVADIVTAQDGVGNAVADAAGMTLGGTAGFFLGGPLGASMGAGIGKAVTDGVQGFMGGNESEEERKLLEALALLQGGTL